MPADIEAWRLMVERAVLGIADENMQRRAWFGLGPEVDSPDEMFCKFFDNADVKAFLLHIHNGLNPAQLEAGARLLSLMEDLSSDTPQSVEPSALIDDPRMVKVRGSAAHFLQTLKAR